MLGKVTAFFLESQARKTALSEYLQGVDQQHLNSY
jgi:hypothetical protein